MKKLNHDYATIVKRTGLSQTFVRNHQEVNYNRLMNIYYKRIKGKLTDREVKDLVYGMRLTRDRKNTIWNAYVRTYMSHVCLHIVPIKEHSNIYINYKDMVY